MAFFKVGSIHCYKFFGIYSISSEIISFDSLCRYFLIDLEIISDLRLTGNCFKNVEILRLVKNNIFLCWRRNRYSFFGIYSISSKEFFLILHSTFQRDFKTSSDLVWTGNFLENVEV